MALAGVGAAILFLNEEWVISVVAAITIMLLGLALNFLARKALPDHPVRAVYLFQGWLLIPLALAVIASAAVIVVTIELSLPKGTPTETEKLVAAVSTGITAFLTAGFISWTSDDKDSRLADHVKSAFEAKFTMEGQSKAGAHPLPAGSAALLWAFASEYGGIEGWGWKARNKRAKGIAAEL